MNSKNVYNQILQEVKQSHITRKNLFTRIESRIKIPIISFFTSFVYPVMIDDGDADMIEEIPIEIAFLGTSSGLSKKRELS